MSEQLKALVRSIPDYPKPGIVFRDVTTLFADPDGLKAVVEAMSEPYRGKGFDYVAGIDARGFILGQLRRRWGCTAVQERARLLLARIPHVGRPRLQHASAALAGPDLGGEVGSAAEFQARGVC